MQGFDWDVLEPPTNNILSVNIRFIIKNNHASSISKVSINFEESKFSRIKSDALLDSDLILAFNETIEPSSAKKLSGTLLIYLDCFENIIPSLEYLFELRYFNDLEQYSYPEKLSMHIPVTVNLFSPTLNPCDPQLFTTLLSDSSNFPYASSTQFSIGTEFSERTIDDIVMQFTSKIRFNLVELVPGAASIYAKSIKNAHVAGLVKVRSKVARVNGNVVNTRIVSFELKCGDKHLLDALIDEIGDLGLQLN